MAVKFAMIDTYLAYFIQIEKIFGFFLTSMVSHIQTSESGTINSLRVQVYL